MLYESFMKHVILKSTFLNKLNIFIVCELVGLLILYEIEKENIFEQNKFGICRDDDLAIV